MTGALNITNAVVDWLMEGEPWLQYRTRIDLLGQPEDDPAVRLAKTGLLNEPKIQALLVELGDWPGTVIVSHKSAGQPFHKLSFLADLGLQAGDPGVDRILARVMEHQSVEGAFQLPVNIPRRYGGSGQDTWGWALCDAPILVYALARMGLRDHPQVKRAAEYLAGLARSNGWPCAVSAELGSFHGPGRRDDPCPYATLVMLKALAEFEAYRDTPACRAGAETLLRLWQNSLTEHPYIFYMGTDFRKLKVPFIWYDLLHTVEVLSRFGWVHGDKRFVEMLSIIRAKADALGRYTVESAWAAWKGWEFGQKKEPSSWLTLLVWRLFRRVSTLAV